MLVILSKYYGNNRSNIRMVLLREGIESHEYLFIANGNKYPVTGQTDPIDITANAVATRLTNWNKDAYTLMD